MKFAMKNMKFAFKNMKYSIKTMKFSIKSIKFSIKNIKFSIKNMNFSNKNVKFSVYKVHQNSSFVLFVTEFSYHMYTKNAFLNRKQKQMKPLTNEWSKLLFTICLSWHFLKSLKISANWNNFFMLFKGNHERINTIFKSSARMMKFGVLWFRNTYEN